MHSEEEENWFVDDIEKFSKKFSTCGTQHRSNVLELNISELGHDPYRALPCLVSLVLTIL